MSSTSKMERFLAERVAEAQQRQKDLTDAEKEQAVDPQILEEAIAECVVSETAQVRKTQGIGRKLVKEADDKILESEKIGLFTALSVTDRNAIPTLLARLPIFIPIPSSVQKTMLDKDGGFVFETPFGRGRRFGPLVTINDEDVLFAMLQLAGRRLIGQGSKLPVPVNDPWLNDKCGNLTVQIMIATVGQIISKLGLNDSGLNYKTVLGSIKRLSNISIELETKKRELYLGDSWNGQSIRIVDVRWKAYETEGLIFAQFSPIIVKWLKEQATYHNWKIRRKIKSENGRALYRFLCTQGDHYKAPLEYIADVIHWYGNRSRLKPRMEAVLNQLRDEFKWCDFKITGTGRNEPFVLEIWKNK